MDRIPEKELMDDVEQAEAYASADFSIPHNLFVELFQEKFSDVDSSFNDVVLDLGCGSCDITRRFSNAYPDASFHAVDGAVEMLRLGHKLNTTEGLSSKIRLVETNLPKPDLPLASYHIIICNSLLHHLKNYFDLWQTIKDHAKPYAHVFVMDLIRPVDEQSVQFLVNEYAASEPDILKQDFENSLRAAYTVKEVKQQLNEMGLTTLQVEEVTDRHMIIFGTL